MKRHGPILLVLCTYLIGTAWSAEPRTEHTFKLAEGESPPEATLDDVAWLVGSWSGTAFGQRFEEVWNPASADSMVGMFKLFNDDGVSFYEILTLTVDDGTLSLKVKHFNRDFTAWEEKEDYVEFRLVSLAPGEAHFGGISFYQRGPDRIDGYIVMRHGEEVREHKLEYHRVAQTSP